MPIIKKKAKDEEQSKKPTKKSAAPAKKAAPKKKAAPQKAEPVKTPIQIHGRKVVEHHTDEKGFLHLTDEQRTRYVLPPQEAATIVVFG